MENMDSDRIYELMRAMDHARRAWRNADTGTDINKSQFFTLMVLRNKGRGGPDNPGYEPEDPYSPLTLSELAEKMRQTMPAVSQRITKLQNMGYVKRVPDENDRRTVWICLTEKGNDVLKETSRIMFNRMAQIMVIMEERRPQSVEKLIDGCNSLADAVNAEFQV